MPGRLPFLSLLLCACANVILFFEYAGIVIAYEIRGKRVMLDFDLAKLYQVTTSALNQAVKRNSKRFPPDFMFQLSVEEVKNMSSQFVTTSTRPTSTPPFAFTEQGVAMLSGLLKRYGL